MKNLSIYLALFLTIFGITACDDENEEKESFNFYQMGGFVIPDAAIDAISVSLTASKGVGINGGQAPFTIKVDDTSIATAAMSNGDLSVRGVKLGTTSIRVSDANGASNSLEVKVVEMRETYEINKTEAEVEGEISAEDKEALMRKVVGEAEMQPTGSLNLIYTLKDSGDMELLKTKEDKNPVKGTFEMISGTPAAPGTVIKCLYNNAEHRFVVEYRRSGEGPTEEYYTWKLKKDVTADYKGQYAGVTSVKVVYKGGGMR